MKNKYGESFNDKLSKNGEIESSSYYREQKMYKEYNDAIKEINSILESLEDKASEIIDLVKSDLDGNEDILESIDEYLDYFSKEIDTYSIDDECILFRKIDEYETWFREFLDPLCEDIFLGESLKEKLIEKTQQLSYLNLYLMTLKWLLTKDESLLDDILFIIESEYTEGFIYPVDDAKYWTSEYDCINNLKVDKRIKQFIIYVDYFYKCYKDYVESYKEKEEYIPHIKVFNNNTIWETDYLEEKIYSLPEGKQYSRKEYYEITRTLTYEEKIETGKYAIIVIEDYIEVINIIKLIIKELSINDCDYSKLFKFTSIILENYSNLLYVNHYEYDFNSNVSSLECDTLRYMNKRMAILYILLLKTIANKSIEEVLQSKCMLLPFANWNNSVVNEEFENAILKIVEHIENVLKNEEDLKIIRESVSKLIGEFGFEDNIVSSMINTLSTAEYLYNTYIIGGYEDTNFDYSFISILYYQAIENILNNLVFYPYKQYCISHKISKNNAELFFINPGKFGKIKNNKFIFKDSVELGPMGYLLEDVFECENFRLFLRCRNYNNVIMDEIKNLGSQIKRISKRRNDAAHASRISYYTAKQDKEIIFDETIEVDDVKNMRNLLMNTLHIFIAKR